MNKKLEKREYFSMFEKPSEMHKRNEVLSKTMFAQISSSSRA
jgi:hypothetical protein